MVRKALALLVVAAIVGVTLGAVGLLWPTLTGAQAPASASRSFSPPSVARGSELEVTVTVGGYGAGGRVEETLPAGFSYVDGSAAPADIRVTLDGQTVRFTMTETTEFTYKVSASSTEGDYTFNGVLKDLDMNSYPVGGASRIRVGPNASRSFSMTMTGLGDEVTVTITAMNYGQIGAVVETIPMGFLKVYINWGKLVYCLPVCHSYIRAIDQTLADIGEQVPDFNPHESGRKGSQ